jgi:glycosyltransferase involved in cell wall biosynthesis
MFSPFKSLFIPPPNKALSLGILRQPQKRGGRDLKGVLILNHVDEVCQHFPTLKNQFILIERIGWHGMCCAKNADIKLIEDPSTLEKTRRNFPKDSLLFFCNADFVDDTSFVPNGSTPEFDVIQIACWSPRKRIELFIKAAAKLPHLSFVQMGHFEHNGTSEELGYREKCIQLAQKLGAKIYFPFRNQTCNNDLPNSKEEINDWINRARIGVLTATPEGCNRFKMECLAADRPMLIASDAGATTQRHINEKTGSLFKPTARALATAITRMLATRAQYSPRSYLLQHSGRSVVVPILQSALKRHCEKLGIDDSFTDIDWDGRNSEFLWGEAAWARLKETMARLPESGRE